MDVLSGTRAEERFGDKNEDTVFGIRTGDLLGTGAGQGRPSLSSSN